MTALHLQLHKLYLQTNLLSFGLLAFEFDLGSFLKLGIEGATMRKFGIVHHAIGRNCQDRRLLGDLTNGRQALQGRFDGLLVLG